MTHGCKRTSMFTIFYTFFQKSNDQLACLSVFVLFFLGGRGGSGDEGLAC